jgi:hypothetical protein
MSVGVVTSVRDLVVLVQFDEDGPEIGELVIVQNPFKYRQYRSLLECIFRPDYPKKYEG